MKKIHISEVLSITTGHMLSLRGMEGIYHALNHVTQQSIYTHQIPRALRAAKPHILKQYPELESFSLDYDAVNKETLPEFMKEAEEKFGSYLEIEPLPLGAFEERDPVHEAAMMLNENKGEADRNE